MTHKITTAVLAMAGLVLSSPAADAEDRSAQGFVDPVPIVRIGPPAGFQYSFDDGRLNPNRGIRTARGNAQSSQIWTDTVPRREIPFSRAANMAAADVSAASRPAEGHFVQVASFRHDSNAQRAAAQVSAAGLPSRIVSSGRYRVVLAGPLTNRTDRAAALQTSRALGYSDAFLR